MKYKILFIILFIIFGIYFIFDNKRINEFKSEVFSYDKPNILSIEDIKETVKHYKYRDDDIHLNITGVVTGKITRETRDNIIGEYMYLKDMKVETTGKKYYILQLNKHSNIVVPSSSFSKVKLGDIVEIKDHKGVPIVKIIE